MVTGKTLADRARRRLFGKREVGLDQATITRRVRLGRTKADQQDDQWPHGARDLNPIARRLSDEARSRFG